MEKTPQDIIRETVADLLQKMGFEAVIEVMVEEGLENVYFCMARVEQDQNLLIGQYGVNLAAIQHLVRVMLRKKTAEKINVIVDVNDYFSGKKGLLEKEAQRAAEEAVGSNLSITLRPMLSYERKIVHSFLAENSQVTTESIGRGDERKVTIHPKPKEN